jgi:hypothetical protein
MLSLQERSDIIALIKQEVIPAIGCTEPVAVALAVARAKEVLGAIPNKIEVSLSTNMLKNAMGVGIPGTGMVGLPIAIALGALIGKSEYGLEVLKDLTPEALEQGKKMSVLHNQQTVSRLIYQKRRGRGESLKNPGARSQQLTVEMHSSSSTDRSFHLGFYRVCWKRSQRDNRRYQVSYKYLLYV